MILSTEMRNQGNRTDTQKTKTKRHKCATVDNISFINQQERNERFNKQRQEN